MKRIEKEKAIELRKTGESIKVIAKNIGVSVGSVSRWVRDITLTEEQLKKLGQRIKSNWVSFSSLKRRKEESLICQKKREICQQIGRKKAKESNTLYAIGCMLYWAEGYKKNNKHTIKLSNSDPYLIKLFLTFLRNCFATKDTEISLYLNHYTDIVSVEEAQKYWLKKLELPKKCLRKATVNNISKYTSHKRSGLLKYGTCALVIHNTELLQKIYGGIQEYGGFTRKAWLIGTDDRIID